MAGFGGAVKLTGASEYRKSLQQITQDLKIVSAQMKSTASVYELGDMKEKDLIKSSKELRASLEEQRGSLTALKNQLSQMSSEYEKNVKAHQDLVSDYEKAQKLQEQLKQTLGETSKEYEEQSKVVADLAIQVEKSDKALEAESKAVKQAQVQTAQAEATFNQTAVAIDNMGTQAEKSSDGFTVMKGVLANLATDVIRSAIDGLKQLGQAFVDVGKEAITSYADFEQLEGGVTKIFGEDMAQTVIDNAQNAFATAGLSANEYMETVTGFSASLIQSLDGDTQQATEIADRAIRDMSDNANTFGTDMSSIMNAYQSFAKGNYNLLDNLRLGYGGTKEEMERLLSDASQMTDVMEELGITVDASDMSFANIANAISVVQANMGIMGTTTKEASTTIQGSFGSMRSAWQNLLTGMADDSADFTTLASNFIGTLISEDGKGGVIGTLVPRISTVISGMSEAIQTLLPQLVQTIVPLIEENIPVIMDALNGALRTAMTVIPQIVSSLSDLIPMAISEILNNLPLLEVTGIRILTSIMDGISSQLPALISMLPDIIYDAVNVFNEWLPNIVNTGILFINSLVEGLVSAIPNLLSQLPMLISGIIDSLLFSIPQIIDAGITLFSSLVSNLPAIINQIVTQLPILIQSIITSILSNLPLIVRAGIDLFTALISNTPTIIVEIVKSIPLIIEGIITGIRDSIPALQEAGTELFGETWEAIKYFFNTIVPESFANAKAKIAEWLTSIIDVFRELPAKANEIIEQAVEFIKNLPYYIGVVFGEVIGKIVQFYADVWNWVTTQVPQIISGVVDYVKQLPEQIWTWLLVTLSKIGDWAKQSTDKAKETGKSFIDNIIDFVKTLPETIWDWLLKTIEKVGQFALDIADKAKEGASNLVNNILDTLSELPKKVMEVGKNIVEGLWEGITSMGDWIKEKMSDFADGLLDGMKDALGIESPSKVFRDEVGKYIAQGIGVGFENEMQSIAKDMQNAIPTSFATDMSITGAGSGVMNGFAVAEMVDAFKEALYQVKIEMDDEAMGQFVDKTVTNLVYS